MRDALARHHQWCEAEGLAGRAYEEQRAQLASEAATELDRLGAERGRVPAISPRPPRFGDVWNRYWGSTGIGAGAGATPRQTTKLPSWSDLAGCHNPCISFDSCDPQFEPCTTGRTTNGQLRAYLWLWRGAPGRIRTCDTRFRNGSSVTDCAYRLTCCYA